MSMIGGSVPVSRTNTAAMDTNGVSVRSRTKARRWSAVLSVAAVVAMTAPALAEASAQSSASPAECSLGSDGVEMVGGEVCPDSYFRYTGTNRRGAIANAGAIVSAPDGNAVYVVTGERTGDTNVQNFGVVAYRTDTERQLWSRVLTRDGRWRESQPYLAPVNPVAEVSADGRRLYLAYTALGPNALTPVFGDDWVDHTTFVAALDTATGEVLWQRNIAEYLSDVINNPAVTMNYPGVNVVVSPDGNRIWLTTTVVNGDNVEAAPINTSRRTWTISLESSTGQLAWVKEYISDEPRVTPDSGPEAPPFTGDDQDSRAMALSPDGSILFAHLSLVRRGVLDYGNMELPTAVLIAYDAATGKLLWQRKAYSSEANGVMRPTGLVLSPDGNNIYTVHNRQIFDHSDPVFPRGLIQNSDVVVNAYAVDDGSLEWSYDTASATQCERMDGAANSIQTSISGALVYVITKAHEVGGRDNCLDGDSATLRVIALNTDAGHLAWSTDVPLRWVFGPCAECSLGVSPGPDGGEDRSVVSVAARDFSRCGTFQCWSLSIGAIDAFSGELLARALWRHNAGSSKAILGAGLASAVAGTRVMYATSTYDEDLNPAQAVEILGYDVPRESEP